MAISEMCSAENIMGSKLMLAAGIKSAKIKDEPLLKDDPFESTKLIKGSSLKQILVALAANCGTINTGLVFGYTAVSLPQLKMPTSRIFINRSQASWIASVSTIGTPCGCILAGYLTDLLGRKRTLIALQLPAIVGWLLVGFAPSLPWIYVGRFLVGLSSGMIGAPSRVYTAEVSQPHVRGVLAAFASVGTSLGVMLEYSIGSVVDWDTLAIINATVPALSLLLAFFIPESPSWLISSKKDETRCRASLKRVRDSKCDVETEVQDLITFSMANESTSFKEKLRVICQPSTYKPFVIVSLYFLLSQFSGLNVVTFYAVDVIRDSGSSIDKYAATIVLGIIRLIFTIIGCMLMRRLGRKPLSYISSVGCGVSMICFAGYMYKNAIWRAAGEPAVVTWFPTMVLYVFYACSTIGYLIVPWVMIGEVFPRQIRGMIGGVTTCVGHFCIFIVLQTYPYMQEVFTKPGTFGVYGVVSLLSTWFFYYYCPETKGKTLQEIEESFGKKKPKKPIVTIGTTNAYIASTGVRSSAAAAAAALNNNNDQTYMFPDIAHALPNRTSNGVV
ncbi:facilitated trehalose transporter Tret1-2 homolog [Sipha flava]|uniref:Facilitated trehalose transporter Tret1-2 homolog n=1 Tax=Sipha flava TaxID=143950 RepID=A0A8B8GIT1_9HEMI|nr:facilitated trehalose transporter Tret1-2 homolog [Sipha flava]